MTRSLHNIMMQEVYKLSVNGIWIMHDSSDVYIVGMPEAGIM
jgi:hypothetical protein